MNKPTMRVVTPDPVALWNDNQQAAREGNHQRCQTTRARSARDKNFEVAAPTMPHEYPQAVSQMQVYWARGELRRALNGKPTKLLIPELEALANTPLAALPERAERKKPAKQAPAEKPVKTKSTTKCKAKEA